MRYEGKLSDICVAGYAEDGARRLSVLTLLRNDLPPLEMASALRQVAGWYEAIAAGKLEPVIEEKRSRQQRGPRT